MDPNTSNLDPDHEFWLNLDPDPGFCKFLRTKLKIVSGWKNILYQKAKGSDYFEVF